MTMAFDNSQQVPVMSDRVCACFDITYARFVEIVRDDPTLDFEALLKATKAGSKCTACLLDLELLFVETSARFARGGAGTSMESVVSTEKGRAVAALSLKERIYAFVDRYSPAVHPPETQNYYLPVIGGHGIQQFVWIANRSLLFEGNVCAPPMDVELTVRSADGRIVYDEIHHLGRESDLRIDVSRFLPPAPEGMPQIGSVRIARKATSPGFRGTTRPQIEVMASGGAACVHGQAPARTSGSWQTFLCRPREDRLFFGVANASNKPMTVTFSYPHPLVNDGSPPARVVAERARAHGALLHEVLLTDEEMARLESRPFSVRWECAELNKAYIMCATPDLSSFSIDHV
jgi:bacterioferritin-associated ferredoxin